MPIDWASVFTTIKSKQAFRSITIKRARSISGSTVAYGPDLIVSAGIAYKLAGFDYKQQVLYPEDRIEAYIWLRDWFGRATDGATTTELAQMVTDLKGDVKEGSAEHFSRYLLDGQTLKLMKWQFDHRPDGVVHAVLLTLQAAQ